MNSRYKGAVSDRDLDRYFPVRISIVIFAGLPPREWSVKYTAMREWLIETVGNNRHAVLSSTSLGDAGHDARPLRELGRRAKLRRALRGPNRADRRAPKTMRDCRPRGESASRFVKRPALS
jgi:hypothetical protein